MILSHISYTTFVPQGYFSHEGYLSGLTLNKNHTSLLPEYRRVLRFYGYDVGLASGNTFPPTTSTTTTTTTTTTTMSTTNEDVSSTMDTTETMTTMEPKGMVTESNDVTGSTAVTYTTALSATETVKELDTTTEQDSISTAATSLEAGITLVTLNIPGQSTTLPTPPGDDITIAGESTTLLTSDAASGNEQASSLLSASITSPASPTDDEGMSTSAEITSSAVQGKVPEESAPTVPQETTEQQTQTAEPTEQQIELTALMEQSTEIVSGTEKPTEIMALTEETTETVTPTEQTETSPMGTVLQTVQATGMVAQTEQTGTVVPTEQPTGMETLTEEQTEMETLTEEPTGKMTVLPVTNIADNAVPDNATEHVVSTEIDTRESTVPDTDVLIQSTNGISEPETILSTPLPLAHNLPNPTQHENSTLMSSKRTTRSIEGKVLFVSVILHCLFCHEIQILFVKNDVRYGPQKLLSSISLILQLLC